MQVETIFKAELPNGARDEGLSVGVVDGSQVVVVIELDSRRRSVTLDRAGALRMADAILSELSPNTLSEDASLAAKSTPEGAAAQIEPALREAYARMSTDARESLRRHEPLTEARRCIAEALAKVDADLVLALAVDMSSEILEELAHEPRFGLSNSPGHPHYRGRR